MRIEDIKDQSLGELFHDASYASTIISTDARDALRHSKNDQEFAQKWKQKL